MLPSLLTLRRLAALGLPGLCVLGFVGHLASCRGRVAIPGPMVGEKAPDFTAATAYSAESGRQLRDYRRSVVLLNFWATWCAPCRHEMPSLQRLYGKFRAAGLEVVAVSIDGASSGPLIRRFREEYELEFDILHDSSRRAARAYGVAALPHSILINRSGVVIGRYYWRDWFSSESQQIIAAALGDSTAQ